MHTDHCLAMRLANDRADRLRAAALTHRLGSSDPRLTP